MPPTADQCILYYTHVQNYPRHEEALRLVKPIMRAHGWKINVLSELHPEQAESLGLNFDEGEKVFVRLRNPKNSSQFLPIELMTDILLHELCHNECASHDDKFHKLWENLRAEMDGLLMKGYAGEGSLAISRSGGNTPFYGKGNGASPGFQGGQPSFADSLIGPSFHDSFRQTISRRGRTANNGCVNGKKSARDMHALTKKWMETSIRTRAETDSVSDATGSQALWNVVQNELRKNGTSRGGGGGRDFLPARDPFPASPRVRFQAEQDPVPASTRGASRDPFPASTRDRSQPSRDPFPASLDTYAASRDTYATSRDRFPASRDTHTASRDPFPVPRDTYATSRGPFPASRDTYATSQDPYTVLRGPHFAPPDTSASGGPFGGFGYDGFSDAGRPTTRPPPQLKFYWTCPVCSLHNTGSFCNTCGTSRR